VLLRMSVAVPVLLDAYGTRQELPGWVLITVTVLSGILSIGFLTPMVAVLVVTVRLVGHTSFVAGSDGGLCMTILGALALVMLGPGAYSIDACRFGRRVVVLPPRDTDFP
jgi:putative oxidoreductase